MESHSLFFFSIKAPTAAKMIWEKARATTTTGNPPSRKPSVVPSVTEMATDGETNIATKMATWLASVKDAGSSTIFTGEKVGMMMPIAQSSPAMAMVASLLCFITFPAFYGY